MRKPISQREARALKRRVRELETRDRSFRQSIGSDYPGAHIATESLTVETRVAMRTAAKLGCVCVGRVNHDGALLLYAVPKEVRANG